MDFFDEFLPLAAYEHPDGWDAPDTDDRYDEYGVIAIDLRDTYDASASVIDIIDARYGPDAVESLIRVALSDEE